MIHVSMDLLQRSAHAAGKDSTNTCYHTVGDIIWTGVSLLLGLQDEFCVDRTGCSSVTGFTSCEAD